MTKAMVFVLALIPGLLSLVIALLFERGIIPNVVWEGSYQIDAAGLISRSGLLASVFMIIALVIFWRAEWRAEVTFQAEKRLQRETRRRFLRRLDHELKNPLTIIKVGLVNMQNSPNITSDQDASLQRIGQQAERLQKLVQDLRWLSELEPQRLELGPVELSGLLKEAIQLVENTYPGRIIDLHIQQIPWPLGSVSGDRDMLLVVLRNLLDNALKYSSAEDRVDIRATDDGQWARIEVADTGLGIPQADASSVFEELYRGQNVAAIAGSGLGLALAWRIIKLHNGTINVRSKEGQGTVVIVHLKLSAPAG